MTSALTWAQEPEFRSGTRYVEVDVTVRHKRERPPGVGELLKWYFDSGPPFGPPGLPVAGLEQADFTLLDNGKPQPIAYFSREARPGRAAIPIPQGAFSNRSNTRGAESNGGAVILVDLLNTPFDLLEYAKLGFRETLRSLGQTKGPVAVYTLGRQLHILQDLTDDPEKLEAAIRLSQETGHMPEEWSQAFEDTGGTLGVEGGPMQAQLEQRFGITMSTLHGILQHLSGLPGRKNLVWLSQNPPLYGSSLSLIERANVSLYPVKVRGAAESPGTGLGGPNSMTRFRDFAVYGGRAFFDARDLNFAVETAAEDLTNHYVLGFYPPEDMLDGTIHKLEVKVAKQHSVAEVHYRTQYVATKQPPPPVDANFATLLQLIESPLQGTGLGLAARAEPDARTVGAYRVLITVDLRDVRMQFQDGRFRGTLEFAAPDPASSIRLKTGVIRIDLPEDRYLAAQETGHTFATTGVEAVNGEIRLLVRDAATKVWGSVRFPAP